MAESFIWSSPVTAASAMMGMPNPPNATGAVLAMSDTVTAFLALKPRPTKRKAETATGPPKPRGTLE